MRTGRSLTVCCSLLPGGSPCLGGCLPGPGGVCLVPGGMLVSAWSRGGFSLPRGEVFAWSQGGFSLPRGGVCLVPGVLSVQGGLSLPRGVSAWSQGGLPVRGVSAWSGGASPCLGGCLPGLRGVLPAQGGWVLPAWGGLPGDPPVDRITDTCKNITLATTSLRPVKIIPPLLAIMKCDLWS